MTSPFVHRVVATASKPVQSRVVFESKFIVRAAKAKPDKSSDKSFYAELDEDSGLYCVFGDNSGFAYSTYSSIEEAKEAAAKKNQELKNRK